MNSQLAEQKPLLIKGMCAIIGEISFGVNGPFFFERFGLNIPEAIATGVVVGAVVGVAIASVGLYFRHREPARREAAQRIEIDAHLQAHPTK